MRRLFVLTLFFALLLAGCQPIQRESLQLPSPDSGDSAGVALLPLDANVRVGKLDNGLTYYIRKNSEPEKRAELWLAINAGSVLEDADQAGLAHFLEHMMFNGTRRFPSNELVAYLESIGMRFGPDVNAYTSFDETVYTLQVPTDNADAFGKAFDVLQDWAAYATLDPAEIDAERGVIVEEWRLRDLNADGRVNDELVKTLLADSQYAQRLPIGDMEIVRNAPPEAFQRFYSTWYRPDLMSVIAVGDFSDLDAVETQIKQRFATLAKPATPAVRPSFAVPEYGATGYRIITDPEYPYTLAYVVFRQDAAIATTVDDFRGVLVADLAVQMLNVRLDELTRKADAPFLYAEAAVANLVRPVDIGYVVAQTEDGKAAAGLNAVMTEVERVLRHGFTQAELERAGHDLLRQYQRAYDERDNIDNKEHAQAYLDHFLTGATPVDESTAYSLAQQFIPTITLEEANANALTLFPGSNRAVVVTSPEKADVAVPDEAELAALLESVAAADIAPYAEETVGATLLDTAPAPAAVTAEAGVDEVGVSEITLANGVRVIMKPTDFKDDEVLVSLYTPGGTSLVADADYPTAYLASDIVAQSGVGQFNQTELQKLLAGKAVEVVPNIDATSESISGSGSPQDLETIFQLIYLYATEPRVDGDSFSALKRQIQDFLKNRALQPETQLEDATYAIFCAQDVRCNPILALDAIDSVTPEQALTIYRERFADLGNAAVVVVGNFDVAEVTSLAQSYLGTLPATGVNESWRNTNAALPQGIVTQTVTAGQDQRSVVRIVFSGPFTPSVQSRIALRLLTNVLDIRVTEVLREEMGGIYGASVAPGIEVRPEGRYRMTFEFTADPGRVDELVAALFGIITDIQQNGPPAETFASAQEQQRRSQEQGLTDNAAWLTWLNRYAVLQEDKVTVIPTLLTAVSEMTVADVQAAAQELLPADRYVKVILDPEGYVR